MHTKQWKPSGLMDNGILKFNIMSLLDDDLEEQLDISMDIHCFTNKCKEWETQYLPIQNVDLLFDEELKAINLVDSFYPKDKLEIIPTPELRQITKVIISDKRPMLCDYIREQWNLEDYAEHVKGEVLLGCYKNNCITLYIYNIRDSAQYNNMLPVGLLTAVYIHELYHAYFNKPQYYPYVEEPLSEFGTLLTLKEMENCGMLTKDIFEQYYTMVDNKRNTVLEHYSYGVDFYIKYMSSKNWRYIPVIFAKSPSINYENERCKSNQPLEINKIVECLSVGFAKLIL